MKSRLLFRESGYPIRTCRRFDGWWIVSALLVVLAFQGIGYWIDHGEPAAQARGYAAGSAAAIAVLQPLVDKVYEAGLSAGEQACLAPTSTATQVRQ